MMTTFRAHFNGQVIVPDQPVDLPVNEPLEISLRPAPVSSDETVDRSQIEDRLKRLRHALGRIKEGPVISDEALRRENLYEERL